MTAKDPPSPKFDLATSNFPPLPGCVDSIQGETTPEMRLSDVVRGLKVTNKVDNLSSLLPWSPQLKKMLTIILNLQSFQSGNQEVKKTQHTYASEVPVGKPDSVSPPVSR